MDCTWNNIWYFFVYTQGIMALDSPNTGIVDWRLVALTYGKDFQEAGGTVITDFEASDIKVATESPDGSAEGESCDLLNVSDLFFIHITAFIPLCLFRAEISHRHQKLTGEKLICVNGVFMIFWVGVFLSIAMFVCRGRRWGVALCWRVEAFILIGCLRYLAVVQSPVSFPSEEITWCLSQRKTTWSGATSTLWVETPHTNT